MTIKNPDSKVLQNNDIADLKREMEKINKIKLDNFCNDMYFYLTQKIPKNLLEKETFGIINLSEEIMNSENNYLEREKVHDILNINVKHRSKKVLVLL